MPPTLQRMERGADPVNLFQFREMRALLTPEWRRQGAAGLTDPKVSMSSWRKHLGKVTKSQWVAFLWRAENDKISPDRGVLLS